MMAEDLEKLTCYEIINKLVSLFGVGKDEEVDEVLDWLLFTYSPEHAFALVQENRDALSDAAFLELVMTKVKDIYEPEIFLETLNLVTSCGADCPSLLCILLLIISPVDGTEQTLAVGGVAKAISTTMTRDMHNARSQILACKVISNLCHDPQVRNHLGVL